MNSSIFVQDKDRTSAAYDSVSGYGHTKVGKRFVKGVAGVTDLSVATSSLRDCQDDDAAS